MLERMVALIPAYNPDDRLPRIVGALLDGGMGRVIVIDDGSREDCRAVFADLDDRCTVLRHTRNRGKGASLRTGLLHVLERCGDCAAPVTGVVTVDADGQHAHQDVLAVAREVLSQRHGVVLGVRALARGVPLRSRIGNALARGAFGLATGRRLADTQCGLRGFSPSLLSRLTEVPGDGYEYETHVLMRIVQDAIPIRSVPIRTIYDPGNPSSHFRPLLDSMRIWAVLLRYSLASLTSAALDYVVFAVLVTLGYGVLASVATARACSFLVNYALNRNVVFRRGGRWSFVGYSSLVIANVLVGVRLIEAQRSIGVSPYMAKVLAEAALFFVNFVVQRLVIFAARRRPGDRENLA